MRSLLALAVLASGLVSCQTASTDPQAQAGFRAAAPIIAGLNAYRADHGHYPAELKKLVPRYLRRVHEVGYAASWEDQTDAFQYSADGTGYSLVFVYYNAHGSDMWFYESGAKRWKHAVVH
jgi:hypothetical protein